jgi:hypothetical protein
MQLNHRTKLIAGAAAILAAAGGGAAVAASNSDSPSEESSAIIDDAAAQLGISPSRLGEALKTALGKRVDAAVAAGRITKAEGDAIKERIQADDFPLLFGGGLHRGFHHLVGFDAAADYLGLTEAQLRTEVEGGKSLAQVAHDRDKSVDGLVAALVDEARQKLDQAVTAGRLTPGQRDELLGGLEDRITRLVNTTRLGHPPFQRPGFRVRHLGGPFS